MSLFIIDILSEFHLGAVLLSIGGGGGGCCIVLLAHFLAVLDEVEISGEARWEVQVDGEDIQLQNVRLTAHQGPQVWTRAAQVPMDELLHICARLRDEVQRDKVRRDVLRAYTVHYAFPHTQRSPITTHYMC